MSFAEYDDFNEKSSFEDMEEKIRHYSEVLKNRRLLGFDDRNEFISNELPGLDTIEDIVLYCLENNKFVDAVEFCDLWTEIAPYSSEAWQKKELF